MSRFLSESKVEPGLLDEQATIKTALVTVNLGRRPNLMCSLWVPFCCSYIGTFPQIAVPVFVSMCISSIATKVSHGTPFSTHSHKPPSSVGTWYFSPDNTVLLSPTARNKSTSQESRPAINPVQI